MPVRRAPDARGRPAGPRERGALIFDDATASADGRRARDLHDERRARGRGREDPRRDGEGARRSPASSPDFLLPTGFLHATSGRVCYAVSNGGRVFAASTASRTATSPAATSASARPRRVTPDNRALQRVALGRPQSHRLEDGARPGPRAELRRHWRPAGDALRRRRHLAGRRVRRRRARRRVAPRSVSPKGKLVCTQCHCDTSGCTACAATRDQRKEESATAATSASGPSRQPSATRAARSRARQVQGHDDDPRAELLRPRRRSAQDRLLGRMARAEHAPAART